MTIIASVLAILLVILIVRISREDIKEFKDLYVDFIKSIPTRDTYTVFKDDIKHAGATIGKALVQIFRALKLVGCWLCILVLVVLIPLVAAAVTIIGAYRK